jgi:hypothetical protein
MIMQYNVLIKIILKKSVLCYIEINNKVSNFNCVDVKTRYT